MAADFETRVLTLLDTLVERGEETRSKLDGLGIKVDGLRTDVDGLRTDVDGLRTDVVGLHHSVDRLERRVGRIKLRIEDQEPRLFAGERSQTSLEQRFTNLESTSE